MTIVWAHAILPTRAATTAAVLVAGAVVIQATLERTVHARQIVTEFLPHQTAISVAAMAMGYLRTGSPVLYRANLGIVSLVLSHRARLVCFPLFQCARLMWIVWVHGQSVQTTACRRHSQ